MFADAEALGGPILLAVSGTDEANGGGEKERRGTPSSQRVQRALSHHGDGCHDSGGKSGSSIKVDEGLATQTAALRSVSEGHENAKEKGRHASRRRAFHELEGGQFRFVNKKEGEDDIVKYHQGGCDCA